MYDASKDEEEDGDDDALKIAIDENATSTFSERHFNNSFSRTFILNVRWSVALSYKKNNYEFSIDYNLENDLYDNTIFKSIQIEKHYVHIYYNLPVVLFLIFSKNKTNLPLHSPFSFVKCYGYKNCVYDNLSNETYDLN